MTNQMRIYKTIEKHLNSMNDWLCACKMKPMSVTMKIAFHVKKIMIFLMKSVCFFLSYVLMFTYFSGWEGFDKLQMILIIYDIQTKTSGSQFLQSRKNKSLSLLLLFFQTFPGDFSLSNTFAKLLILGCVHSEMVTLQVSLPNLESKVDMYFVHNFHCSFAARQFEAYLCLEDRKDISWTLIWRELFLRVLSMESFF